MEGKYTINAVDRAGVPWEVCMTDHADSAGSIVDALQRQRFNDRHYWITLTDDPERGEVDLDEE